MEHEINSKNTKNEILEAYDELLKKVQEKKTEEPKKVQERQKQETLVKTAEGLSDETIIKEITALKMNLSSELDKLGEKFVSEFRKFEDLQHAIEGEQTNLQDLYQLSVNTDSLSVMLMAQKEKKAQFEQEMTTITSEFNEKMNSEKERFDTEMGEKRSLWKKEQESYQQKTKEETEESKKKRTREEEEYLYTLKINRKKESDIYEEKKQKLEKELANNKAAFEKEFTEREFKIKDAETELKELRLKSAAFPAELKKAVDTDVKLATDKLQATFRFEKELREKEIEGELRLKDQIVETLKGKIKDVEASLKELSQKAVTAEASVKDIAIKAIESSSKSYFIDKVKESQGKE